MNRIPPQLPLLDYRRPMDGPTLETVYRDHRQGLFTFALTITKCKSLAEDAVHDAFSRLAGRPFQGDLVAYVYRCVRNAAYDVQRKNVRTRQVSESIFNGYVHPMKPIMPAPDEPTLTLERDQMIRNAIEQLPKDYQEAVVMKLYSELTFKQISDILGQPLKTIATRYRRALSQLGESLKDRI